VATLGVHPHDAAAFDAALERDLAAGFEQARVVAVGEVGLDYHYDHSPRDVQQRVFRHFVRMARQLKKPLVVHTRSAPDDTLTILREEGAREVGGVIHCFSEDMAFASAALDLGFDISFSGILTFKSARSIREVAAWLPDDRLLVETDSPYLAPVPRRGRRCEPAYIVHTVQCLAELRAVPVDHIVTATTENAIRRFGPELANAVRLRQN
jgi:TatD DNase family protein